ncbi:nuclear transport factor 2 family protein [Aestuariivivens insulae]|uniref:nuclear transport factor 2 family protein n=1 Tax=Aestuariivivens insulae TaxID=1621988 RepID=UPI001F59364E|nr:nuclear transport factor 2 family protein [Aestuariivivens insulae]
MYDKNSTEIKAVISDYFNGIYNGDATLLEDVFHTEALLFGDINGVPYFKTAPEYIAGVKSRKSPKELDEDLKMKIIGIDIMSEIAMVKLHVPMLGYNYYDYLSLTKINNDWKIVNKIFTHVE